MRACAECRNSELCTELFDLARERVSKTSIAAAKIAFSPETALILPSFAASLAEQPDVGKAYLNTVVETQWAMGCSFSGEEILANLE